MRILRAIGISVVSVLLLYLVVVFFLIPMYQNIQYQKLNSPIQGDMVMSIYYSGGFCRPEFGYDCSSANVLYSDGTLIHETNHEIDRRIKVSEEDLRVILSLVTDTDFEYIKSLPDEGAWHCPTVSDGHAAQYTFYSSGVVVGNLHECQDNLTGVSLIDESIRLVEKS